MIHVLEMIVECIILLMITITAKVIYPLILIVFILCCTSIIFLIIAYPIIAIIEYIKEKT